MTDRSPRAARLAWIALLPALLALGCGRGPAPLESAEGAYAPMTSGPAEELWDHVGRLERRYSQAEPTDPASARDHLRQFTSAVIATCDAILADPKAPSDLRGKAANAEFACLQKRRQIDPKATDALLAFTDKLEAENPDAGLATYAAVERVTALQAMAAQAKPDRREALYKRLSEATIHLAEMKSSPPMTPDYLDRTARDADGLGYYDIAKRLFETFRAKYPDDDRARFAAGALTRMASLGQVPENLLKGPGVGGKPVSAEDFRGKVVLVSFWSTGWKPAVEEAQEIESFRKAHEAEGLVVLGVCLDPDPAAAERLIVENKLPWPQILTPLDVERRESPLGVQLGIPTIPYKFVLDRDGRLVAMAPFLKGVQGKVEELLAAKPAEATPEAPAPK